MSRLVPYAGANAARDNDAFGAANQKQPTGAASTKDRLEAVAKYVPGEILAFFLPVVSAIELLPAEERRAGHWIAFIVSWVLVPIYMKWVAGADQRGPQQIAVSTVAFPIWAYATNREIGALGPWFSEPRALIVLLCFSLLTAFLLPKR